MVKRLLWRKIGMIVKYVDDTVWRKTHRFGEMFSYLKHSKFWQSWYMLSYPFLNTNESNLLWKAVTQSWIIRKCKFRGFIHCNTMFLYKCLSTYKCTSVNNFWTLSALSKLSCIRHCLPQVCVLEENIFIKTVYKNVFVWYYQITVLTFS